MNPVAIAFALVLLVIAGGGVFITLSMSQRAKEEVLRAEALRTDSSIEESQSEKAENGRRGRSDPDLDARVADPRVQTTLDGLTLTLDSARVVGDDLLVQLSIEKELGVAYVVDDVTRAAVLHEGDAPIGPVRGRGDEGSDPRVFLAADVGKRTVLLLGPAIAPGKVVRVHWSHTDPRTHEVDQLVSSTATVATVAGE